MRFTEKLKARAGTAIIIGITGVVLMVVGFVKQTEMASSFGLMFLVIGIARILQYMHITKDADTLKKHEIAETDERNVMLWTKARALAFSVYIIIAAIAVVVLYLFDMNEQAKVVSYSLSTFVLIYWVCYIIIRKKY